MADRREDDKALYRRQAGLTVEHWAHICSVALVNSSKGEKEERTELKYKTKLLAAEINCSNFQLYS